MIEQLKQQKDDELIQLITDIEDILKVRDLKRKQAAMEKIKKLAEQVGLNVAVKKRGKRKLKPKNHHRVKS